MKCMIEEHDFLLEGQPRQPIPRNLIFPSHLSARVSCGQPTFPPNAACGGLDLASARGLGVDAQVSKRKEPEGQLWRKQPGLQPGILPVGGAHRPFHFHPAVGVLFT